MNTKSVLSIIIVIAVLIASCKKKKEDVTVNPPPAVKKVYVTGYEQNSSGFYIGKYWVDSIATMLAVAGSDVTLTDVEVSGSDVYILGIVDPQSSGTRKYTIWKNGTIIYDNIAANNFRPFTKSIIVKGSDIYVCGESTSSTAPIQRPAYWKNGTVTILPQSLSYSYATDIFVDGSNVYVLGRDYSPTQEAIVVWTNGTREVINGCIDAESIIASGTDVYVAGADNNSKPAYWKNGVKTLLPIPASSEASCSDIKVNGTDIYVSGTEFLSSGQGLAVYWKNGTKISLPVISNFNTEAYSMDVEGNNIYVCGYAERNSNGDYSAVVWKNGVLVNLTPSSLFAEALSVKVR
jgi:hypothetical protein